MQLPPKLAFLALLLAGICCADSSANSETLRIGNWNIANLHHEDNVPLREGAPARDAEDYSRLQTYVRELNLDIIALQEIGSPAALARLFPPDQYHLFISDRYKSGDENRPANERDIFTAFAIRKTAFPSPPTVTSLDAFSIVHIGFDRNGQPSARKTRNGLLLEFTAGAKTVQLLNVHVKSSCHTNSINPVLDETRTGKPNKKRFDCRTVVAQAMILENWIEQQIERGRSVIVVGDFNRQLNRFDQSSSGTEHFWGMINDGEPSNLMLRKGPLGKNEVCWPKPHSLFHAEHIEFVIYDTSLDPIIDQTAVAKLALPHQTDPKYAGREGYRLSDHCPTVFELKR